MFKSFFLPASLMAGAIIGAGMFSLPYIFSLVGIWTGVFYLTILTGVIILIHLLYSDVIIRTDGQHNFVGYTKIYLGKWVSEIALFISVFEMVIVMVIYLILSASFFNLIFQNTNPFLEIILFWFTGSLAIFWSLKRIAEMEFFVALGTIFIVFFVFFLGWKEGVVANLNLSFDLSNWALPIGPILFALSGRMAVAEVIKYFSKDRSVEKIKRAIIWGSITPVLIYLVFILGILLILDGQVTEDGITGLVGYLSPLALITVGILGILELWTSYIAVGFDVHDILRVDLRFSKFLAGFVVVAIPIILYLFDWVSLIESISLVGGLFLSLEGILIILMWLKVKKMHPDKEKIFSDLHGLIIIFLVTIFIIALIYELHKIFLI